MYDQTASLLMAFFLLAATISSIPYLLRDSSTGETLGLSPVGFLAMSSLVIVLSLTIAVLIGLHNFALALAIGLGIGASLLHPVVAICFFIACLLLRPWEAFPQNAFLLILPRLLAALTFLIWFVNEVRTKNARIVWNQSCWLFVFFLSWILLCSIISNASVRFFFETYAPISVIGFLILNTIKTQEDLLVFVRTIVISVVGIISVALYITARDATSFEQVRLHSIGLWGNANDLAAIAVCVLPLVLGPLIQSGQVSSKNKLFAGLTGLLLIAGILWSQSRGAVFALSAAGLSYFLLCGKVKKSALFAIVFIALITLITLFSAQRQANDLENSTSSRMNYLVAGIRMAQSHPIFGVGLDNYSKLYEQYTPGFSEWGVRTAHSSWVLILAEAGVIGLLFFVSLYLTTLWKAWKMRNLAPQFFLALIGYGITISFLSHTYLFLPYVLMALVIAAARIYSGTSSALKTWGLLVMVVFSSGVVEAQSIEAFEAFRGADKPLGKHQPIKSETLQLKGSRGETLVFLMKASGRGCVSFSIKVPAPVQNSVHTAFYSLPYIKTEHPSFPGAFVGQQLDPVVPINQKVCLKDGEVDWFLGEITPNETATAGTYDGSLSLGKKSIPMKFTIWQMVMPPTPSLPAYAELTPWYALLGHYGKWHDGEAPLAKRYISTMKEHRIYPLKSTIAPLQIDATQGSPKINITDNPSKEASFESLIVQTRPDSAYYDFPTMGSSGFETIDYAKAENYFSAVENSIKEIDRPGKAIVYLWDEPQPEAMKELQKLSRFVKSKAPSLKQLVTTTFRPELETSVDIFAPVINQFDADDFPPPAAYQRLQEKGHEVWWYVSCMSHGCEALTDTKTPDMVIDREASYVRSIAWLSKKYGIDAFLYFSVVYGYQFYPKRDPWNSLWDFSGNGDGTLFYPGRPGEHGLQEHQPIASLRLKLWREASYDAEYIRALQKLKATPSWWESEFNALTRSTTAWSRDYNQYQALRDKAGQYINDQEGNFQ